MSLKTDAAHLADAHDVDIVVLVESSTNPATMLQFLNAESMRGGFHLSNGDCPAVTVFIRFSRDFI